MSPVRHAALDGLVLGPLTCIVGWLLFDMRRRVRWSENDGDNEQGAP
jgi:hypothetical protein